MLDLRPILLVVGTLLSILSVTMLAPAAIDYLSDNDDWEAFASSSFVTGFVGMALYLTNRGYNKNINIRQAFLLTTSSYVAVITFAAIPLMLSELHLSFTDAFFEMASGLTTTGATVIIGLDSKPPGILLWRGIMTGLGGIGIVVMALALLPMLRVGGMQIFRTESSDRSEKVLPRATQIATVITVTYGVIALAFTIILWMLGMTGLDAICHSFAALSTAGFANYDASIGHYTSASIHYAVTIMMIIGALPMIMHFQAMRGEWGSYFHNSEIKWFFGILGAMILSLTIWVMHAKGFGLEQAFRESAFNLTSVMTTTGFVSTDYSAWGSFPIMLFFMATVMGGCTGSTTGGIKMFRFIVFYETAKCQVKRLIQPHGVFTPRFQGRPISEENTASVMSFILLFGFCFIMLSLGVALTGLDFLSSMSSVAQAMSNTGPGLGEVVGPCCTYTSISPIAKWLLSFAMILGRLELFTVLVLFSPYFWKE